MTQTRRIVVISDCTDVAFAEMRGAIAKNALRADYVIEPLVPVYPFSVVNAAFILRLLADSQPEGTILNFIMNSVRERTERIVGTTERGGLIFEGTNTGALGWLIDDFGCREIYELHDPGFVPFGGKYVHAPAVGKMASGVPLAELGKPISIDRVRRYEIAEGEVVHIDNFGNIKFRWELSGYSPGDRLIATINGREIKLVYWVRMMERNDGEWVLYPGSSFGLAEIGQVRGPGMLRLDVAPGDAVAIRPE